LAPYIKRLGGEPRPKFRLAKAARPVNEAFAFAGFLLVKVILMAIAYD
jgi:hypothetical protein